MLLLIWLEPLGSSSSLCSPLLLLMLTAAWPLLQRLELAEEGSSPMASSGQGSGLPEDALGFFHQQPPEAEALLAPTEQHHAQGSGGPAAQ